MLVMKRIGKLAGCILLFLIGFDIVGAIACLLLDIVSFGDSNTAAYYALWLVLGIFCGLFSYDTNGRIACLKSNGDGKTADTAFQDWASREGSGKAGLLVIFMTFVVMAALSALFNALLWDGGGEASGFVPDSRPLTLTYFGAVLATSIFMYRTMRAEPKKSA